MKKFLLLLLPLMILFMGDGLGQRHGRQDGQRKGPGYKKLEQLEKIKLLEVLNLDDETAIKFFNRRDAHKEKMMSLGDQSENIVAAMQEEIKKNENSPELPKLVKDFNAVEEKIDQERQTFINSLSDILSPSQVAKIIVFERNFRSEVRNVLMREKLKRQNKNKD